VKRLQRPPNIFLIRAACLGGALALAASIAAVAPNGNFVPTFAYVACTLAVCAVTTLVTIRVLTLLGRGKSGNPEIAGLVEIGLLIGLFVVSPLTLTGAFELLEAVVGGL
jgi:hypothetical protein